MNTLPIQIGHDILEIARIRKTYARYGNRFLHRILTNQEITYCLAHADPVPRIAARFSAKESIAKALGTGIHDALNWKDIEIQHTPQGAPFVILTPSARERFCDPKIALSISHCHTFVSTTALWMKESP